MARNKIVVGVDVGSSKVVAVVAEISSSGGVRVIGLGAATSLGFRKGLVVDIEQTSRSIKEAVTKAEQMSGLQISTAYVGITGSHTTSVRNRGVVAVSVPNQEIGLAEIYRALQAAKVVPVASDKQIIHVLPREYIVDGYDGIKDPTGMTGSRLEVQTQIIIAASAAVQNIVKCLDRAGIGLDGLVLAPLASASAVLLPAEKELGTTVVDMGAGTTEIAIFESGTLFYSSILPVGGDYVTGDLAVGLRTPLTEAERVKREHGCVLSALMPDDDFIEIPSVGGQSRRRVSKKLVATIVEPRMREFLEMIKAEIGRANYHGLLPGGVVLTGGVSRTEGLVELCQEIWDLPVRVGVPQGIGGLEDMISFPEYATGVGLICYAGQQVKADEAAATREAGWQSVLSKVREWFKYFFD